MEDSQNAKSSLMVLTGHVLTPLGAILSIVTYFCPWEIWQYYPRKLTSGFAFNYKPILCTSILNGSDACRFGWVAFLAAMMILAVYALHKVLNIWVFRTIVVLSSLAGLITLIIWRWFLWHWPLFDIEKIELKWWPALTALGFFIAALGSFLIEAEQKQDS